MNWSVHCPQWLRKTGRIIGRIFYVATVGYLILDYVVIDPGPVTREMWRWGLQWTSIGVVMFSGGLVLYSLLLGIMSLIVRFLPGWVDATSIRPPSDIPRWFSWFAITASWVIIICLVIIGLNAQIIDSPVQPPHKPLTPVQLLLAVVLWCVSIYLFARQVKPPDPPPPG